MSHYDYLETNLPLFFLSLGISWSWERCRGIIVAHGDKCYGYRNYWEKHGLVFAHGVAIYLLSYVRPFSQEVRETPTGWVDPKNWVLENKERFLPHLPPVQT